MTGTGWTPQQLDAAPWPDVVDLLKFWRSNPPLHVNLQRLANAFLQEETPQADPAPPTEAELHSIAGMFR